MIELGDEALASQGFVEFPSSISQVLEIFTVHAQPAPLHLSLRCFTSAK
jgi:hypothetical protein